MRIRVAILDSDKVYLDRFVTAFSAKFADKIELYSFTELQIALDALVSNRIEIFLASETFEIDFSTIPPKCVFAYFVDGNGIESYNNQNAIGKFQRADLIYKQILSLYSESGNGSDLSGASIDGENARIIMFSSPCGGVGTSTVAAACAQYFSSKGNNVLYLNLEPFGSSDLYFSGDGQYDMSEVIYALKSRKTNLSMKLESCVKKDASGVSFYSATSVPLDMLELTKDDIVRLIGALKLTGSYNYIVIDIDFGLAPENLNIFKLADYLVWVSDGENSSNKKIVRAFQALSLLEQNDKADLIRRLNLMYNRYSSKTGKNIEDIDAKLIGGIQVFVHNDEKQVVDHISKMSMFDNIL